MITVLIVDHHPLFRTGLSSLLDTVDDVTVVAATGSGQDAVALAIRHRPDVVLMDLNLPGTSGLEATRQIVKAAPSVGVLVLTMVDDDDAVLAALRVGARGYVLKGAAQEEVLAAVRSVAAGGAVFGAQVAQRVLSGTRVRGRYVGYDLTEREAEVLVGIAEGKTNPQIARQLGISVKTVQNHVTKVLTKLQVTDRTQAALRMRGFFRTPGSISGPALAHLLAAP